MWDMRWWVLLVLGVTGATADCNLSQAYYIRTATVGLTLDGATTNITVEYFTGFESQQWTFECGSQPGLYYIVNVASGNVLDVLRSGNTQYVQASPRDGTLFQQWSLDAYGRIVNAEFGHNIDVIGGFFVAGNGLWLYEDNDTIPQQFILQEKMRKEV